MPVTAPVPTQVPLSSLEEPGRTRRQNHNETMNACSPFVQVRTMSEDPSVHTLGLNKLCWSPTSSTYM